MYTCDDKIINMLDRFTPSELTGVFLQGVGLFLVICTALGSGFAYRFGLRRLTTSRTLEGMSWANSVLRAAVVVPIVGIGLLAGFRNCLSNMSIFDIPCQPCCISCNADPCCCQPTG